MIIGIGTDITHLSKFNNKSEKFIDKILTNTEKKLYYKRKGKKQVEFLAGHFAAKEAIIKALANVKKINMLDIEILYKDNVPFTNIDTYIVYLSISHDDNIVISNVIITTQK